MSAGVTMTCALYSILTGKKVRADTAMTGEVTLTGRVLAIGGLREKVTAAYNAGIKRIIIPQTNVADLEKIDPEVKSEITFIPCTRVEEVLKNAMRDDVPAFRTARKEEDKGERVKVIPAVSDSADRRRGRSDT